MDEFQIRQMLPIGTLLKQGEYRVVRYIASGGFGNTYEVEHVRLGKHLALKEFFMRGINQREGTRVSVSVEDNRQTFSQMREKFYKEAQRLARLEEQHIVEVTDFFEDNETAYYVMKLIDGESLAARMKRTGHSLGENEVRCILPQVLLALKTVHGQGIFHLDIKPGNIMQNAQGFCWLIDFGASKQLSAQESMTLSTSTGLCYTPGYAPSEQISGSIKRIGPWTDFYALGATLYNLLTNEAPPEVDDVTYEGEAAFHFPLSVGSDIRQLVLWLMQADYRCRPQSVADIEQRLSAAVADTPSEETVINDSAYQHESEETKLSDNFNQPESVKTEYAEPEYSEPEIPEETAEYSDASDTTNHLSEIFKIGGIAVGVILLVIVVVSIWGLVKPSGNEQDKDYSLQNKEYNAAPVNVNNEILQKLINNMVLVEGGTFQMGSNDIEADGDEKPVHSVIVSTFYIGKYEVTQEEWETVMDSNPSAFKGAKRPVERVTWEDCQTFIQKLNEKTGLQFRLPTEAEWEYAARGGKNHDGYCYSGSSTIDGVAWYSENSGKSTHEVGKKTPNSLGLYDMSGNVFEWCQDWYDSNYYSNSPSTDPWNDTPGTVHVFRGGFWADYAKDCRVSCRSKNNSAYCGYRPFGLRLAR